MKKRTHRIRYAVVGQGYISQAAVLPAFKHARENSELVALVSENPVKLKKLGRMYGVKRLLGYEDYSELLTSGEIDAVYIALPNFLHRDFAVAAAQAGVHVLCEKPIEVSSLRALEMIQAARYHGVKLMTAYRLHFEEATLTAADLIHRQRRIGDPKIFSSLFTIAVDTDNYRAGPRAKGGGPIFDVGVYCINAARMLFRDEPIEATALDLRTDPALFNQSEESMAVSLRFPGDRVAGFVCSFGAYGHGTLSVAGTQGVLTIENAYEYLGEKRLRVEGVKRGLTRTFARRDQFAPELLYFSDCVLRDREPEPSGVEGLADIRVIEAILKSAETGRAIAVDPVGRHAYPGLRQEILRPPVRRPRLVAVRETSKKAAA
jgi:glucose-fructose oxidoreductase